MPNPQRLLVKHHAAAPRLLYIERHVGVESGPIVAEIATPTFDLRSDTEAPDISPLRSTVTIRDRGSDGTDGTQSLELLTENIDDILGALALTLDVACGQLESEGAPDERVRAIVSRLLEQGSHGMPLAFPTVGS